MSRNKKLLYLAIGANAILMIAQMILEAPWWKALLFCVFISCLIGVGLFMALGMGVRKANELVSQAIETSIAGEFSKARQMILTAVRLDSELLNNRDVHSLYESLVTQDSSERAMAEARRVKAAASGWSKSPLQRIYASDGFYQALTAFIALMVVWRILSLFQN